jgi:outer membrane lipoprotein LolB
MAILPMPIRPLLQAIAAAGVLVLAGCATPTANIANPNASVGAYRDTIDLSGRLTANWQKDGQLQSITGKFEWTQRPGRVDVSLANPLGQTIAEISVTPESATLTQGNHPPRVARDIDALSAAALGWPLPVSGLRDWLQGYATDAQGKRFAASPAHDSVVTNDGWRLHYVSWQDQPAGAAPMPLRIDASRGSQANGDALDIHVIVNPAG